MIVDVLSHDGLIVSNFDEIEPFTNTLLDGAIALIRAYPEDTEVCLLAFGFLMRVIAASYARLSVPCEVPCDLRQRFLAIIIP